ncbi:MAG: organic hydroperoxide resistance protein [Mycobacterium sp.]|nr:organic hydroperoxide resistance protein [Mycobacterium sp.]
MAKVLYTAHAHVTGGREGHARTADGELEVDLRAPKQMGGPGGGTTQRSFSPSGTQLVSTALWASSRAVITWMPVRSPSTRR